MEKSIPFAPFQNLRKNPDAADAAFTLKSGYLEELVNRIWRMFLLNPSENCLMDAPDKAAASSGAGHHAEDVLRRHTEKCRELGRALDDLLARLDHFQNRHGKRDATPEVLSEFIQLECLVERVTRLAHNLVIQTGSKMDALGISEETRHHIYTHVNELLSALRALVQILGEWRQRLSAPAEGAHWGAVKPGEGHSDLRLPDFLARN